MAFTSGHPLSPSYNVLDGAHPSDYQPDLSQERSTSPSIHHGRNSQKYSSVETAETTFDLGHRGLRKRTYLQVLNDWWAWEVAGVVLSFLCLSAIIAILASLDGKPLSIWNFPITPNAMISTFATVSKVSLITALASCVGQLKWSYFQDRRRSLSHLQHFDDASRGPWGSLTFLWFMKAAAPLTSLGAILTILAMGIEPFAQQVLDFPLRYSPLANVSARTSSVQFYNSGWDNVDSFNPAMVGAILDGIYSLEQVPQIDCPTGTCDFPVFKSLGMCSKCANVTATTKLSCDFPDGGMSSCLFQTPSGFNITLAADTDTIPQSMNGTPLARVAYSYSHILIESNELNMTSGIQSPLSAFGSVKFNGYPVYLLPGPLTSYDVTECAFYLCEKTYENARVTGGIITADPTPAKDRQLYATPWYSEQTLEAFNFLSFDPSDNWETYPPNPEHDGDPLAPPGRQFSYAAFGIEYLNLREGISSIFSLNGTDNPIKNGRSFNFLATPLWHAPDLSALISNVTTSITNNMRFSSANTTITPGTAYGQQTYIYVRWAWLVLPAGAVLLGIAVLVLTIRFTARNRALLWKSSSLALLLHGIDSECDEESVKAFRDRWTQMGSKKYLSQMEILSQEYLLQFDPGTLKDGDGKAFDNREDEDGGGLLRRVPRFVVQEKM